MSSRSSDLLVPGRRRKEESVPAQEERRNGEPLPAAETRDGGAPAAGRKPAWEPIDFDRLSSHWESSLDTAESAIRAAAMYLPSADVHALSHRLTMERVETGRLLEALAQDEHFGGLFFNLTPRWELRRLLGLPEGVVACVFDLDGVLTGSAAVHAAAWKQTFGEFISARIERTGGTFLPFSRRTDYPLHLHGRPRLDGVRAFLASRGIRLAEGTIEDPPGTETVYGLANRKNEVLLRLLDEQGVTAFEGSRRYLAVARRAGVGVAVVSASANTKTILARSGLTDLVETVVDGSTIAAEGLRAKPEPDTLLSACRQLGVEPRHTAAFETTAEGIAACRAAGLEFVIGVDRTGQPETLRAAGADVAVGDLAEFVDRTPAVRHLARA